jgi:ferredoxin
VSAKKPRRLNRRDFLVGSAAGTVAVAAAPGACTRTAAAEVPHRWIDPSRCIGCGSCVPVCPMGAIHLDGVARTDPRECAECGVCQRSRVCPRDAIRPGRLEWPRTLREAFSNPLIEHKSTGVLGRGTEETKTNDTTHRYLPGFMGVLIEPGRPALGARLREVERVVKKFRAAGYSVVKDNPVAELIADAETGAFQPEVLDEKVISALVEFILPQSAAAELLALLAELSQEAETVFNVSIALRAGPDGASPLDTIFWPEVLRLPNGKVNLGLAEGIARSEG